MNIQFQYITDLAKKYSEYSEKSALLYKAINELPTNIVDEIFQEYGDSENKFQPVNLLRAEAARQLINGVEVTETLVEEIKEKIRTKELTYFNHLPEIFLDELAVYAVGKRDIFANWQKPWSIFHTFFYRTKWGKERESVQSYLEQIAKDLLLQLDLKDYTFHTVDFQG
jgi:5-methylcytosine-specific restriction protein B